jgi:hypothetical protein
MDYVLEPQREMVEEELKKNFDLYGVFPLCVGCSYAENCVQYNAPGVTRLVCPRGEWIRKNGRWQRKKY